MKTLLNEELLSGNPYFDAPDRRHDLREFFDFDHRRILFGIGVVDRLGEECKRLGAGTVFLVRDSAVSFLDPQLRHALNGLEITSVFDEVLANPSVASVDRCAQIIAETDCDVLIAVGGGSTMDTVKTARCVARAGGSVSDYFGMDQLPPPPPLPLIAIPTTAGTGAEVSRVSVVVSSNGKEAVYSDYLTPEAALVDPLVTQQLPKQLTATTGLDALGHALECTASLRSNDLADAVAREALRAGCPYFERALSRGAEDSEARTQMARCSLLAGLLLSPVNTGAGHALGYGIEKCSHQAGRPIPHGTAVAFVLPGVLRHNSAAAAAADKYYYAAGVAGLQLAGHSREQGVAALADWIDQLRCQHTPFPTLSTAGLTKTDLPTMVETALSVRRLLDPNPVKILPEDAERIYREIL